MAINPLLFKYKGNRCANCGLTVEEMQRRYGVVNKVFQFNHIDPKKKHPHYDNLIQRVLSTERLDEVDKCVLLCNNCHDVLHAQAGTAEVIFTLRFPDRVVDHRLKGQAILDMETQTLRFFSDQQLLLSIYAVRRGDIPPYLLTALELNDGRLLEFLLETQHGAKLLIWKRDKTVVLEAEKRTQESCCFAWHVTCPLFQFMETDSDGKPSFWIRHGKKIYPPKGAPAENPEPATGMIEAEMTYEELRQGLHQLILQR
jgi:hypothetical protein